MKADERLYCRCGIEVRVVRLGKSLLTLGHKRNPKDKHHYVRLAAPSDGRSPIPVGAHRGAPLVEEAPRRGGGRSTGPDRDTLRANSNPLSRARRPGPKPPGLTPRSAPSVGRSTAGETGG